MTRRPVPKAPAGDGLHLRLVNGETVRLRRFEAARVMLHKHLIALYVLMWVGLTLTDPSGQSVATPFDIRLTQYGIGALSVVTSLLAVYVLAEAVFGGKGRVVVLTNWYFVLFASVLGLSASEAVVVYLTNDVRITVKIFAVLTVFYFVIIELILQLVVWLLLPSILASLRQETAGAAVSPVYTAPRAAPVLRAGGIELAPASVQHIEAQGNYVGIVTDTRRHEVPGPFAALMDQIPDGLGLQVHRSHWVARRAVLAHRRKGRELVLDLAYGGEATVALPRQTEVVQWLLRTAATASEGPRSPASDATPQ